MFHKLGKEVVYLKRVAMAGIRHWKIRWKRDSGGQSDRKRN